MPGSLMFSSEYSQQYCIRNIKISETKSNYPQHKTNDNYGIIQVLL